MRRLGVLLAFVSVAAGCAHLPMGDSNGRARLWRQAHDAYSRDSFRVAAAAFQRLATDHPESYEGHEARFYLGALALEPASGVDPAMAVQHLSAYLAADTLGARRGYHGREAATLARLAAELRRPCGERAAGLRCETVAQPRPAAPAAQPVDPAAGADVARLRRELAERDAVIRSLREELERIRNTLAPRRTPR